MAAPLTGLSRRVLLECCASAEGLADGALPGEVILFYRRHFDLASTGSLGFVIGYEGIPTPRVDSVP